MNIFHVSYDDKDILRVVREGSMNTLIYLKTINHKIPRKALEIAIESRNNNTVWWLLENTSIKPLPYHLSTAVNNLSFEIIRMLYRKGCEVNSMVELNIAYKNSRKLIFLFAKEGHGFSDLFIQNCIYEESLECLKELKRLGYRFDDNLLALAKDYERKTVYSWLKRNTKVD